MQGVDAQLALLDNTFPLKVGVLNLLEHYLAENIICSVASPSSTQHIVHRLSQVGIFNYFSQVTSG